MLENDARICPPKKSKINVTKYIPMSDTSGYRIQEEREIKMTIKEILEFEKLKIYTCFNIRRQVFYLSLRIKLSSAV